MQPSFFNVQETYKNIYILVFLGLGFILFEIILYSITSLPQ